MEGRVVRMSNRSWTYGLNNPVRPSPALIHGGVVSTLHRRAPFEAVLQVLSREDPGGLLASGAPTDEYAREAEDLARCG